MGKGRAVIARSEEQKLKKQTEESRWRPLEAQDE